MILIWKKTRKNRLDFPAPWHVFSHWISVQLFQPISIKKKSIQNEEENETKKKLSTQILRIVNEMWKQATHQTSSIDPIWIPYTLTARTNTQNVDTCDLNSFDELIMQTHFFWSHSLFRLYMSHCWSVDRRYSIEMTEQWHNRRIILIYTGLSLSLAPCVRFKSSSFFVIQCEPDKKKNYFNTFRVILDVFIH